MFDHVDTRPVQSVCALYNNIDNYINDARLEKKRASLHCIL